MTNHPFPDLISPEQALDFLVAGRPLLDVRAEIEFERSHIPGTLNLPILTTEERILVGTAYRVEGKETAIRLGHKLVSDEVKAERILTWQQQIKSENIPALFCARGGMRSSIAATWLSEAGTSTARVAGGYKALRNLILERFNYHSSESKFFLLDGRTGVGKTLFLNAIQEELPTVDLEKAANHRGSAFGWKVAPQPHQATFENNIVLQLEQARLKSSGPIIIEAESAWIGSRYIPKLLYNAMKASDVLVLEAPLDARIEVILEEYVRSPLTSIGSEELKQSILRSLGGIYRRLSKAKVAECRALIELAFEKSDSNGELDLHREWIKYLVTEYYDPLYDKLLKNPAKNIVCRGDAAEIKEYIYNITDDRKTLNV